MRRCRSINVPVEILRCPVTGQPLRWLDDKNPNAGLVTEDGTRRYRVDTGIPILLADQVEENRDFLPS